MLKAVFSDKSQKTISSKSGEGFSGFIEDKEFKWDVQKVGPSEWHVITQNAESFNVSLVSENNSEYTIKINNETIEVKCQSEFVQMLDKMGISGSSQKKIKNVKAPMPGLVISVNVSSGDEVEAGDVLLVLEAMKMENTIKAEAGGIVSKVVINSGSTIEKGELMIEFE